MASDCSIQLMSVLWSKLLFSCLHSKPFADLIIFPALSLLTILLVSYLDLAFQIMLVTGPIICCLQWKPGFTACLLKPSQWFLTLLIVKEAVLNSELKALAHHWNCISSQPPLATSSLNLSCPSPPVSLWHHTSPQKTHTYVGSHSLSRVSKVLFHQITNLTLDTLAFTCHGNGL